MTATLIPSNQVMRRNIDAKKNDLVAADACRNAARVPVQLKVTRLVIYCSPIYDQSFFSNYFVK